MSQGLTLSKLVVAQELFNSLALKAVWWGPPNKRRPRTHHRKPLARWKESMARMEHKAQYRRWRANPVTKKRFEEDLLCLQSGRVEEFMGFKFIMPEVAP